MFAERKWKRANVFSWGCNQLCDCWSQKRTFGRTVWMLVHRSIPRAIGCDTWIEKNWTKKKWIETMVYSWMIYSTHSSPPQKKNTHTHIRHFFCMAILLWCFNPRCGNLYGGLKNYYLPTFPATLPLSSTSCPPSDMMVTETKAMKKTMMGHSPGFPALTALITSALAPKTAGNNLKKVMVFRKSPGLGLGDP